MNAAGKSAMAIDSEEAEMLARSAVTIPTSERAKFEAWVHARAKVVPAISKLASHNSAY